MLLSPLQVVLIAHSQGTIIAGDVLRRLQKYVEVGELDQARNNLAHGSLRSVFVIYQVQFSDASDRQGLPDEHAFMHVSFGGGLSHSSGRPPSPLSLQETGSHEEAGNVQPGQRVSLDEADRWVPLHRIYLQPARHGQCVTSSCFCLFLRGKTTMFIKRLQSR